MKSVGVLHVVGTRPNFMKVAPLMRAIEVHNRLSSDSVTFRQRLVHTGQHYSPEMSAVFFDELGLPEPDSYLDVGPGSHAVQTAALMVALEADLLASRPDLVCVVGDVNSTLAAALVASKLHIPVAHIESGLRSGDRQMPEEINRILTDRLAQILFTTSEAASRRLEAEGVPSAWTHFVGNTMIDCLEDCLPIARKRMPAVQRQLEAREYALLTLHRPSNVDDPEQLQALIEVVTRVSQRLPVVFPAHLRTRGRLEACGALQALERNESVVLTPPLGYLGFLSLLSGARLAMTDSGGIQAEACVLGTPCVTLRTTTEWTETLEAGSNVLADPYSQSAIEEAVEDCLRRRPPTAGFRPERWDGHASARVVSAMVDWATDGL